MIVNGIGCIGPWRISWESTEHICSPMIQRALSAEEPLCMVDSLPTIILYALLFQDGARQVVAGLQDAVAFWRVWCL